jgi:hypothetical protein
MATEPTCRCVDDGEHPAHGGTEVRVAAGKIRLAAAWLVLPVVILTGLVCIPALNPLWPRGMMELTSQEKALQDALPVGMGMGGARAVLHSKGIQFQEQTETSQAAVINRSDRSISAAAGDRSSRLVLRPSQSVSLWLRYRSRPLVWTGRENEGSVCTPIASLPLRLFLLRHTMATLMLENGAGLRFMECHRRKQSPPVPYPPHFHIELSSKQSSAPCGIGVMNVAKSSILGPQHPSADFSDYYLDQCAFPRMDTA